MKEIIMRAANPSDSSYQEYENKTTAHQKCLMWRLRYSRSKSPCLFISCGRRDK